MRAPRFFACDDLDQIKAVPGDAFEVVKLGTLHTY
jgi:hypothetical protein